MCASSSRIGILMLNSPNIGRYAHYATLVNYMYAARHGYGFMVTRCPHPRDMDKDWAWDYKNEYLYVWSKARMLAHALQVFDIVLFLDSDAVVWDFDVTIESKVAKLMGDGACIVMAQDCFSSWVCEGADRVNAGVILARRSPRTSQILEHWMDPDRDCAEWKYKHTREQMCIDILRTKYYPDSIRKVPVEEMNGTDGGWIRHLMQHSGDTRERVIRERLARVLGDYRPGPWAPSVLAFWFPAMVLVGLVVGGVLGRLSA